MHRLTRRSFPLLIACLLAALPGARAAAAAGTVLLDQAAPSAALGRDIAYSIYLPPGFPAAGKRYPVIYIFHGAGGDQRSWLRSKLPRLADQLIAAGRLPPLLIVAPSTEQSFCVDSRQQGGPGDFDTAFRRDLIAAIERKYPVLPGRGGRAVAGNSMGGFCALHLAFEQPYAYAAVASLSGGFFTSRPPPRIAHDAFGKVFGSDALDTPRYRAANPLSLARDMRKADAPATYLAVGAQDGLGLEADSQALYQEMKAEGLPVQLHVDPQGRHDWPTWMAAMPDVLTFLASRLQTGR